MIDADSILEALRNAEKVNELSVDDRAALGNMRKFLTQKIRPKGKTLFRNSLGGYLIGPCFFDESQHKKREIYGLQCIQWLLQDKEVPSITLWSKDTLSPGGMLYRQQEPGVISEDGYDLDQTAEQDFYYSIDFAQGLLQRLDELDALPSTPERENTKNFIEGELRTCRYKREIKSFPDETEKARKNVQKAIKAAITLLIKTPETTNIGLHLQDTITTGYVCKYWGTWEWEH